MNRPKTHSEARAPSEAEVHLEVVRVSQVSKASQISSREHKVARVKHHLETFSMSSRKCSVGRRVDEELKPRLRDRTSSLTKKLSLWMP